MPVCRPCLSPLFVACLPPLFAACLPPLFAACLPPVCRPCLSPLFAACLPPVCRPCLSPLFAAPVCCQGKLYEKFYPCKDLCKNCAKSCFSVSLRSFCRKNFFRRKMFGKILKWPSGKSSAGKSALRGGKAALLFCALSALSGCASVASAPARRPAFFWPLTQYKISRGHHGPSQGPSHHGIDLAAPLGTPVLSSHPGKVVYAGGRLKGYGRTVILEFSEDWATLYAHLRELKVKEGETVSAGESLGSVGQSGRSSGPHLHFELIYKKQPVDPLSYLPP